MLNKEQFTSYEAQVDYYTTMIKADVEWEFVGIYTDEGISGPSTNRREGFKQMIADALVGKIDLIVTKVSIKPNTSYSKVGAIS